MNKQKWGMKLASLILAMVFVLTACQSSGGTYATVNGVKIPKKSLDDKMEMYKSMMAAQQNLEAGIGQSLIQQEVIRQDLEKNKVEVSKDDYTEDYNKLVEAYGGAANYSAALNNMGISDEQMRDALKLDTLSRKHKEWYAEQNKPSDEEMQKYFEDNKDELITYDVSHILVESKEEAEKVLERLNKGEKFEDLAKALSKDPGSKEQGGVLPKDKPASNYYPQFGAALKDLKEGEISQPVQSQAGFHIIRMDKRHDSFDDAKDKIAEKLSSANYQKYLQELVQKAEVEYPNAAVSSSESSESSEGSTSGEVNSSAENSSAAESSAEASESSSSAE